MKIWKKLKILLCFVLCLSMLCGSTTVYAAAIDQGNTPTTDTNTDDGDGDIKPVPPAYAAAAGAGGNYATIGETSQDAQPVTNTEKAATDYVTYSESKEAAIKNLGEALGSKAQGRLLHNKIETAKENGEAVENVLTPEELEAVTEASKQTMVNVTRTYGVNIYLIELDGVSYQSGGQALVAATEAKMLQGSGGSTYVGFAKFGGTVGSASGPQLSKAAWTQLGALNGQPASTFFEYLATYLSQETADKMAQLFGQAVAGNGGRVPALIAYPAFGQSSGSGVIDLGQINPALSVGGPDAAQNAAIAIEAAIGSTMGYTMLEGKYIGQGLTATTITTSANPWTGMYDVVGFAVPGLNGDPPPVDPESTFYVNASPKQSATQWAKVPQTTGTYRLYINVGKSQLATDDGYVDIKVTTNFGTGNAGKGPNAQLTASGGTAELINKNRWTAIPGATFDISTTSATIRIPATHIDYWNQYGGIIYKMNIVGGADNVGEQARPVDVTVTVEGISATPNPANADTGFSASGNIGNNYTSWIGSELTTSEDTPYDRHSVDIPMGEGLVVANTAKDSEASWEASIGIPSTENVSVKLGAQAGMADAYGWMCARPYDGNITVGDNLMGKDPDTVGSQLPNQAVTRKIVIKGSVVNCWGNSNPVCQLKQNSYTVIDGGDSNSAGPPINPVDATCGGHSSCCSTVGGGSYVQSYDHEADSWNCGKHSATIGWTGYYETHSNGDCGSDATCEENDGEISHSSPTAMSNASVNSNSHDCTFSVVIHDSVGEEYIGQTISWASNPGDKYSYVSGREEVGAGNHFDNFLTVSRGGDAGINIYCTKFDVTVSEDAQFYYIDYSFVSERTTSGVVGCHSYNNGAEDNKDWLGGTVKSGTWPSNSVLCQDYTHGTGTAGDHFENMVHQGTHTYTITFNEQIDAYVYRTVENAKLYNLQNITFSDTHKINRTGGTDFAGNEWESGEYSAPLSSSAIGRSVSSPESVGYLWRCVGSGDKHGEYKDGNGRILFEAWRNSNAKPAAAGNVSIEKSREDYFLGDVEIHIKAVQDSQWHPTIIMEGTWDADATGEGVSDRGKQMEGSHIHTYNDDSLNDYEPNCADNKFRDINVGDCVNTGSVLTHLDNTNGPHDDVVRKEVECILNHWSGINSGLVAEGPQVFYKANVISDTMIFGGTELTNSFLDDAYAVDGVGEGEGFGVALFNMHARPENGQTAPSINQNMGEIVAWRSHKDFYGNGSAVELKNKMLANIFSTATVEDGGPMAMFGGVNSSGKGGTKAIGDTTVGKMVTSGLGDFGLGCQSSEGDPAISDVYSRLLAINATHTSNTSGVTKLEVKTDGTTGSQTFNGYWRDFVYNTIGSGNVTSYVNDQRVEGGGATDFGTACLQEYGTLAISNIPLVEWTPNHEWYTGEVKSLYIGNEMAVGMIPPDGVYGGIEFAARTEIQDTHDSVATGTTIAPCGFNGGPYLNEIRIYNPLSVENDYVIGAQYGKFEDSAAVSDDRDHDQRVDEHGNYWTESPTYVQDTKPYAVQSQYLWTWLTPFGNFSSVGGSGSSNTSDRSLTGNGDISRNVPYSGYVDNMNFSPWVSTGSIAYPFIAGLTNTKHTIANLIEVSIEEMLIAHSGSGGLKSGSAKGSILDNNKFYWGNAFGVTNTCNVFESNMDDDSVPTTYVTIRAYGINPFYFTGDSEMSGTAVIGYIEHNLNNAEGKTANKVYKQEPVNLVGSIGNLAIHDTEDFRFSEYFREATDDWLIEGVIHSVDSTKPIRIVATPKDICFNIVETYLHKGKFYKLDGTEAGAFATKGHSTLSQTVFQSDRSYGGMAGYYDPLPLVPSYNIVDEYRTEAVRLGYKSYFSIETIGQYQSLLYKDEHRPDSSTDMDTRSKYLQVDSQYYLYDLDTGKFFDVDLWSGSTGGKERLYNGTSHTAEPLTQAGSIYQNVREELNRWNIGINERLVTGASILKTADDENLDYEEPTYIYSNSHYIGRPGILRLDNRDLSYIGSSNNDSEQRYWGESYIMPVEYNNNAQRYFFKDGLTSTTVITEPLGDNPTQAEIMASNDKVQDEHPHAVLIQFLDFTAKGIVWDIKHNGSAVNQPTFTIYDTDGDDPSDPSDDDKYLPQDWDPEEIRPNNEVQYQDVTTYNPVDGSVSGKIDKDLTPVVVYEAYHTSADDRTIAGTH